MKKKNVDFAVQILDYLVNLSFLISVELVEINRINFVAISSVFESFHVCPDLFLLGITLLTAQKASSKLR